MNESYPFTREFWELRNAAIAHLAIKDHQGAPSIKLNRKQLAFLWFLGPRLQNAVSSSKYAVSYIESLEARSARCHVNHLCYLGREHSRNSSSMIPRYSEVSPAQHAVSSQKNSLRCYMANSRALLYTVSSSSQSRKMKSLVFSTPQKLQPLLQTPRCLSMVLHNTHAISPPSYFPFPRYIRSQPHPL